MKQTHAEHQRTYRQRHPDRAKESSRRCKEANAEKYAATAVQWKRDHPGSVAAQHARGNANYYERYPDKRVAHNAVNHAIESGAVTRGPCAVCGTTDGIHGHHDDYTKPLDVRWLCYEHHQSLHRDAT